MDRLEGLPFYDFSAQNKYASNYNVAYKRAVQAQNEKIESKHSPYAKPAEIEKWDREFKRWKKNAENYSTLAKVEEKSFEAQKPEGLGMKIDFMA